MCSLEMWSLQILMVMLTVDYADQSEMGLAAIVAWVSLVIGFLLIMVW